MFVSAVETDDGVLWCSKFASRARRPNGMVAVLVDIAASGGWLRSCARLVALLVSGDGDVDERVMATEQQSSRNWAEIGLVGSTRVSLVWDLVSVWSRAWV